MMSKKLKITALIAVGLIACLLLIIYFINRDKVYEFDLVDNVNSIDEAYSYVTERINEIDSNSVLISYRMIYRADDLESPESYEFEFINEINQEKSYASGYKAIVSVKSQNMKIGEIAVPANAAQV